MQNLFALLFTFCVIGSSLGQEVISTQGETYTNASGSVDFTFGEVIINTVSSTSNDLTQGFHQTTWSFVGIEDHQPEISVLVFPNPMETELKIDMKDFQNVKYELIDIAGRIVKEGQLESELTSIQVSELAAGPYELVLLEISKEYIKTIKLVKNQ